MALNESDREDLMSEVISLIRRVECQSVNDSVVTVVGFNAMGWLFVYRGADLMYRFDELGRLRRAYVDGLLYRTEGKSLSEIERRRDAVSPRPDGRQKTTLVRRDLSGEEIERFRACMLGNLRIVIGDLQKGVITRQVPAEAPELLEEILSGLNVVLDSREFLAPAIVRRK